jgi:hypothetical protein
MHRSTVFNSVDHVRISLPTQIIDISLIAKSRARDDGSGDKMQSVRREWFKQAMANSSLTGDSLP